MSHYSVKVFFEQHPKLKECFETYDGVIHVNKEIAENWIARHANKTITPHLNPLFKESAAADAPGVNGSKPASGKGSTSKGKKGNGKVIVPKGVSPDPA